MKKPVFIFVCLALPPVLALTLLSYPTLSRLSRLSNRGSILRFSAEKGEGATPSPSPMPDRKAEETRPPLDRLPFPVNSKKAALVESRVTILGSMQIGGAFTRQRYRFQNVHLSSPNMLSVFLPKSVALPKLETSLDVVHGHPKGGHLPTELFYRSHKPKRVISLGVQYRRASAAVQPQCRRWEERPVLLLQVRTLCGFKRKVKKKV